ncbi:MBL fold metallo-hydrolase [Acrocarpospora macrocephala]|uniref:MBL fold metallo-hydrolase n=1 Tax=Acrocarpospora macrocephala TaxID=150177 RepID=UPI001FE2AA9E|nr:MBL fold metallo-hydrolase [Acrocarpospora macrocephala]
MSSETAVAARAGSWSEPGAELVAPGVHRIPLPLPDELAAVNVYALERPDGLTLIDSGQALRRARDDLKDALASLGYALGDVREFLITHAHRDHYTLGPLVRRDHGSRVRIGIREAPALAAVGNPDWPAYVSQLALLRANGAEALADEIGDDARAQGIAAHQWEAPDSWIVDDEIIEVGERRLQAIPTPGHTQGHLVFHDEQADLLFAGDHVLPHITPSIGLEPVPGRSPLRDFLGALRRVRRLPDALLLPAHGPVSPSSHARVDELLRHHDERLRNTLAAVRAGRTTGFEVAAKLPWTRRQAALDELPVFHQMLAVVETSAHLELLVEQNLLTQTFDSGVVTYVSREAEQ